MLESQIIINEKEKLPNIHPGEILKEEFLDTMNISIFCLAKESGVSESEISEIIHKKRPVTASIADRFSKFFGTSAEFWLNLQKLYDLEESQKPNNTQISA